MSSSSRSDAKDVSSGRRLQLTVPIYLQSPTVEQSCGSKRGVHSCSSQPISKPRSDAAVYAEPGYYLDGWLSADRLIYLSIRLTT